MGELKAAMTQAEFERWRDYYQRSPFDDHHRYRRPAALLAAVSARSEKPMKYWLDFIVHEPDPEFERIKQLDGMDGIDDIGASLLAAFGFKGE